MSIRAGHTTWDTKLGQLDAGNEAIGDEVFTYAESSDNHFAGDSWLRITSPKSGWIAIVHQGVKYSTATLYFPEPTPPTNLNLRDIMVAGRLARLRVDWLNPKWGYKSRSETIPKLLSNPPQTVTFNQQMSKSKGNKIPLTDWMRKFLTKINSAAGVSGLLDPKAGWINTGVNPEALSFGGNDVIVTKVVGLYACVHAIDTNSENTTDTFFTPNGRTIVHKFTAVNKRKYMIKLGRGVDAYIPFLKNSTDYWIPKAYLEMYPALPFELSTGKIVVEYLLLGNETMGILDTGELELLYSPKTGYPTNWKLSNPPPPP